MPLMIGDQVLSSTCLRPPRAASWLAITVLWLLAGGAQQVSAQIADLALFQDSIQRIDSVAELRVLLADRSNRAAAKSSVTLTERGFVALRLYDLTSQKSHVKLAESSFKEALKREPQYGWAHYGLGLTYVNGPEAKPEKLGWRSAFVLDDVVGNLTGNDVRSRAHRAFLKAVTAEPPVTRAAEELAENAVAKNKRKTLEDARDVLVQHAGSDAADADSWFALAKVNGELGDVDAALRAMDRVVENGALSDEAQHTHMTLLLRTPGREHDGARSWFEGVGRLTTPLSDMYFDEIEMLLSKREREAWKTAELQERARFLSEFWELRAGLAGVSVAERLAEHYRRLAHVRQNFYRQSKYGAPSANALRMLPHSQRSDFDDRGVIYLRHGAPAQRIGRASMHSYESWVYPGLDGRPLAFHFQLELQSSWGYSLMHKISCDPQWLEDRAHLDPRFFKLAGRCNRMDMLSLSGDLREVAFNALDTDSDRPNFTKELPFFFDLYTFRGDAGHTDVVAAVAVPAERLNKFEASGATGYRIDVSLILADTAAKRVIRQDDSLSVASTRTRSAADLVRIHVAVAVPPSKTTVQRVIVSDASEPGIGQLYGGPFLIPDYTGNKLMLSDVVLAEPGIEGRWRRGAVALALVPTGHFRGGSFNIFYEIYNIAEEARYSTEIEIEPLLKSPGQKLKGLFAGKNTIRLQFDGVATKTLNGTLQELRRVDAPLGPGHYRLRITVKNSETGETAKAEREFEIPE